ncbi:S8 family peptidase, partial [Nocardioides massiliensis]
MSAVLLGAMSLSVLPSSAAPGDLRPATPGPVAEGKAPGSVALSPTVRARLAGKSGPQSVFVTFRGNGAADAARARNGTRAQERSAARNQRAQVERRADEVVAAARRKDGDARRLFATTNAVPGVAVLADSAALRTIAARSDVLKISPLPRHQVTNASAAQLTRALQTWRNRKNVGDGIKVGIIDTGIDYTHAMFGGVGTIEAFEAVDETAADWRDDLPARAATKIAGGYDFVGNAYNADSDDPDVATPQPDPNPIDCNGHGTHVAGTTGGYGVAADGTTYTGSYANATAAQLDGMRIGPGVAPGTSLYALKVFGCDGSTDVTMAALDWALDPNGDGDFADKLDIVNMSLGSSYSPSDDPLSATVAKLTSHGVLTVASAGNEGDLTSVGGNPGNAPSALSVASSVDALQLRDGLRVDAPSDVTGTVAGQVSQSYPWAGSEPVSGDVVAIPGDNADGCDPLSAEDAATVAGKIAWLEWDDVDATRRCGSAGRANNVTEAGAIGALFTSELDKFGAGIAGNAEIPVFQLTGTATKRLRAAAEAGTLRVTLDPALIGTIKDRSPAITDTISDFTSRGEHGSQGTAGPTVTGPGDTITSAGVGTGNDQLTISGTSMSAPHVAGVAALVKKANPAWSVLRLKAAVMNTATADLWTGPHRTGKRYGPIRVGSGRVDTLRAATTKVLAYSPRADNQASVVFAPVVAG